MTNIPANQAIQAYAQAAQALSGAGQQQQAASSGQSPNPAGFADLVGNQVSSLVSEGQALEAQGMDFVQGRADVVDVVTAVAETEVLLETVVTVRDRVIQAYQEIMRMPI